MENYVLWKDLMRHQPDLVEWWQEFYVYFYQAFIEGDRWKQYLGGVGTTLMVTAMALAIGIVLGVLVAMVRTAHDQQRAGHKNPILGLFNGINAFQLHQVASLLHTNLLHGEFFSTDPASVKFTQHFRIVQPAKHFHFTTQTMDIDDLTSFNKFQFHI